MSTVASFGTANTVVWFTSLRQGEQGVTRRILEELLPLLAAHGIRHEIVEPASTGELLAALDDLAARVRRDGIRPILHFDMHGSAADGLRIVASGENVPWPVVAQRMRAINEGMGNDLFVVSAACYGLKVAMQARITEPCPYYVLVGPERTVTAGLLEDSLPDFYRTLFAMDDFVAAYESHLVPAFSLFHSERLLLLSLGKYVRRHCMGKGAARRREDLLSEVVAAGGSANGDVRREIKAVLIPDQALVDRFVHVFLMGKQPGFGIAEVMALVRADMAGRNRLR